MNYFDLIIYVRRLNSNVDESFSGGDPGIYKWKNCVATHVHLSSLSAYGCCVTSYFKVMSSSHCLGTPAQWTDSTCNGKLSQPVLL